MSAATSTERSPAREELERVRVERHSKWTWMWIFPVIALGFLVWLAWNHFSSDGLLIHVRFREAQGVEAGGTDLRLRGVKVGQVETIDLGEDRRWVILGVRLRPGFESVASEGSRFRVVGTSFELGDIRLGTLFSGPYLAVSPGDGERKTEFVGAPHESAIEESDEGLSILLLASTRGNASPGTPLIYRGVEVGHVTRVELNDDARAVRLRARVDSRYRPLVRAHSRFWRAGEPEFSMGLSGAKMEARSLRALLAGAIVFATPDAEEPAARDGTAFRLYEEPEEPWTRWTPEIPLPALAEREPDAEVGR